MLRNRKPSSEREKERENEEKREDGIRKDGFSVPSVPVRFGISKRTNFIPLLFEIEIQIEKTVDSY